MAEKNLKIDDYTIIVGCGRLGSTIASTLSDQGKNVMVIDMEEDSFRKLSPSYAGQVLQGDARDYGTLEKIGIKEATVFITVTHSDNTNIMLSQIAKEVFGVGKVIARLYDPERDIVYKEFGIETIYPAYLESRQVLAWYDLEEDNEEDIF